MTALRGAPHISPEKGSAEKINPKTSGPERSAGADTGSVVRAQEIPPLTHAEAGVLSQTEYERVLALLEQLDGDDWSQPTYCTQWNVHQMVSHLAGSVTGSTTLREFLRQNVFSPYLRETGNPVDGTNKLQVLERAHMTPAELVAEFRHNGQIAVNNRRKLPWIVRKIHIPMGSLGLASFEYLMDTIYPRDQWMHRYDLCAATGRQMVVTPEHDGRLMALVLRELAGRLDRQLAPRSILLRLTGVLSISCHFGRATAPECTIEMDFFDLNLRASGRLTPAAIMARSHIEGDIATAQWFLEKLEVPY